MTQTSRHPWVPLVAVVLLVAIELSGTPVSAQGAFTISGAVRDSTGSVVPGVSVSAINAATAAERVAVTDSSGRYQITGLPGGRYEVRATLAGFRTEMRSIELASDTPIDFALGVELQEQIVVTALRRAERLQDVPATVDAFDAGMIEQAGITSMRDYVGMAPQISMVETQNIGFAFVNVRGLSQVRNSEPTVAVVVDGVLQTTGLGFSEELFDVEQVEVLKGPQGALYGRNASGGAINIMTRQPTNALEGFARASFGNGQNMGFVGTVSGAIVPNVLLGRAAVSIKDADGWRENITLHQKADPYADRSVRGRLLWRPSPSVNADFRFSYANTEAFQSQFVSNAPNFVEPPPVGGLPGTAANFDGRHNGDAQVVPGVPSSIAALVGDPNNTSVGIQGNIPGVDDRDVTTIAGKVDFRTRLGTVTSVTSYDKLDLVGTLETFPYFPFLQSSADPAAGTRDDALVLPPALFGPLATVNATTGQNRFHDAWSQEVRLTSPDNQRLRWILGGYFVKTDLDVMISVNRDLGGGDVVQETDPNIGGVNPTAPWNERFVAAVAPVFTANPGAIPPSCLTGPLPPPVCAANLANPNQNPAALAYNFDRNDNHAYAGFGQGNFDLNEQVEVSLALRYDRDSRQLNIMTAQQYLPVFPFPSGREGDVREDAFDAWQPKATVRWKPRDTVSVYGTYAQGFRSGGFNLSGVAAGVAALRSAGVPGMPDGVRDSWDQEDTRGFEFGFKSNLRGGALTVNASTFYTNIDGAFTFFFVAPFNAQIIRNIDEARSGGFEANATWLPVTGLQLDFALGLLSTEILDSTWIGTGGVDIRGKKLPFNPDSTINVGVGYSRPVFNGWRGFARLDYERLGETAFDPENFALRDAVNLVNLRGGVNLRAGWEVSIWSRNLTNKDYMTENINPNGISWLGRPRQWGVDVTKRF
ncbi:MAG TPA: TonB-dependent receptor [Vicinamibacterales bacterium]|nr:TonB-dependent receptor [Vicinamibacterales bacterium]